MSQALFEVPFDGVSRVPLLPRGADGFTLFDGSAGQGWCLCHDVVGQPATVTVRVETSTAIMAALQGDPALLWLSDVGSPVKDVTITATTAKSLRDWLRDHGYSAAGYSSTLAKVNAARKRRLVVEVVLVELHGASLDAVEKMHIGKSG